MLIKNNDILDSVLDDVFFLSEEGLLNVLDKI